MAQVHSNKTKQPFLLKGLSIEDNAVLGQFCIKYYLVHLPIYKMLLKCYEEEMKQISTGSANPNIFLSDFSWHSVKPKNVWPIFYKFQSMFILAICKR